jgi:2-oxo-4-hydroxy-4-carboxy-5-ureidoimidazoline decarboxylase
VTTTTPATCGHSQINAASVAAASELLRRCCGSARWVERMVARRPFDSMEHLRATADEVWSDLERADYLEAFEHHPRLGADPARLRERFAAAAWSAQEQSQVALADETTLEALREGNAAYEARFGFVFLVCATGKGARDILALLEQRIGNDPATELRVAAAEHAKITRLRLDKLGP